MTGDKYPENTEDTLYIIASNELRMCDILDEIISHFKSVHLSQFTFSAEHTQVRCFGYPQYDPGDYENFIVIRRKGE